MASTTKKAKVVKSARGKKQSELEGRVSISLGATVKVGDFEFARIDVGLQMPFAPATGKERDEVYDQTMAWAKAKLHEEVKKVREVVEQAKS